MVMDNGTIQQLDTPEAIIENPSNSYVREFVIDNLHRKIDSLVQFVKPGEQDNKLLSSIWGKVQSLFKYLKPESSSPQESPSASPETHGDMK
jgi:ABC-type proline/glycine betaine transport system ATPase subunit